MISVTCATLEMWFLSTANRVSACSVNVFNASFSSIASLYVCAGLPLPPLEFTMTSMRFKPV